MSSSNRPAIEHIRWLDNQTISFLGEQSGELHQLYTLDVITHTLTRVTSHATNIVAYAMAAGTIVFAADKPNSSLFTGRARREGIHVSTQLIVDLILGEEEEQQNWWKELFIIKHSGISTASRVNTEDIVDTKPLSVSPNGKYILAASPVSSPPDSWMEYHYPFLQSLLRSKQTKGTQERVLSAINKYIVIDSTTGQVRTLLDAPIGDSSSEVVWAADSGSVIISDVYLPLDVESPAEREARQASPFTVAIDISNGQVTKVSNKDLWLIGLDAKSGLLESAEGRIDFALGRSRRRLFFAKQGTTWQEATGIQATRREPQIVADEAANIPPSVVAVDSTLSNKTLLLDLNPEFSHLAVAPVKEIQWTAKDGHKVKGGLVLPPNYSPDRKYPLIIQPYGFTPDQFWIDGPWPTAFAAQALASKGFIVLESELYPDNSASTGTPDEALGATASYEGAIDYLDGLGLIDRTRIGLVGFSHTCFHIKYALTHSRYRFAAAVAADGVDGGYFQYIAYSNLRVFNPFFEGVNGGLPFGEGMSSWMKLSPGFNLDKVTTPVLIQAVGRNLLQEWEWYSGLSRLKKPVELIYLPFGSHILSKPWEQIASQQGTVDWFAFWLKGEEDPDPAKAEQYKRWREQRKLQGASVNPNASSK